MRGARAEALRARGRGGMRRARSTPTASRAHGGWSRLVGGRLVGGDLGLGRRVGVRLLLRVVGFLQLPVQVGGLVAQDENMPETAAPAISVAHMFIVRWATTNSRSL